MNCRVLLMLMVMVGISLVLATMIRYQQAINAKLEQSPDMKRLESLSKTELARFQSDAKEFYHNSQAARNERTRLSHLYRKIQNDPERQRLEDTLEQYVDWVNNFSNPATMRDIQTRSINERVTAVHNSVMEMRRGNGPEQPLTLEFLKGTIRDNLPQELQSIDPMPLIDAFDDWLTKKYIAVKFPLNEDQLKCLPEFESYYRDLFRRAGIETSPANNLGMPEKLAMIQLIQNFSELPRPGAGAGFLRPGGGPRPGAGGIPFSRFGGDFSPEGDGLRGEFLRVIDVAFDRKERNVFLDSLDQNANQALERLDRASSPDRMDRSATRMEVFQWLLALAVLERYPMVVDSWRFFQANSRAEQDWIKLLGNYLSLMTPLRREEFLKLDSRYTTPRLQGELRGNVMSFFGLVLVRSNRERPPASMGTPPPPRDDLPPASGPNRPLRQRNEPNRDRGQ